MSSPLNYHLTRISSNRKLGPIPASTTSAASCWDGCAYFRTCYAKRGHLSWHWAKVNDGRRGSDFSQFLREVRALPRGQLWRYGQAGELPGIGARINAGQLARLAKANKGRQGFAYTHKPLTPANLKAIRAANAAGFTVNLSANGLKHADKLAKLGLPVVCVIPRDSPTLQKTASGVPVLGSVSFAIVSSSWALNRLGRVLRKWTKSPGITRSGSSRSIAGRILRGRSALRCLEMILGETI